MLDWCACLGFCVDDHDPATVPVLFHDVVLAADALNQDVRFPFLMQQCVQGGVLVPAMAVHGLCYVRGCCCVQGDRPSQALSGCVTCMTEEHWHGLAWCTRDFVRGHNYLDRVCVPVLCEGMRRGWHGARG